jgi:hypothetical protein
MKNRAEYDALVTRVRSHYGPSVEVGGPNSHDINNLHRLAAQAELDKAKDRETKPIAEAGTRLHRTRERVQRAWRIVTEGQAKLATNPRLHSINGMSAEMLEPIEMPKWSGRASTVAEYDVANAEAAEIATEMETRASKITSYLSTWERSSMGEQNRSLILALADRLDRLEAQ